MRVSATRNNREGFPDSKGLTVEVGMLIEKWSPLTRDIMNELNCGSLANQGKASEYRTGCKRELLKAFLQEDGMIHASF